MQFSTGSSQHFGSPALSGQEEGANLWKPTYVNQIIIIIKGKESSKTWERIACVENVWRVLF